LNGHIKGDTLWRGKEKGRGESEGKKIGNHVRKEPLEKDRLGKAST